MKGLPNNLPNLSSTNGFDEDYTLVDVVQEPSEVLIQLLSPLYKKAFGAVFLLMNNDERAIYNQIIDSLNPNQVEYTSQLLDLNRLLRNIGQRIVTERILVRDSIRVTRTAALSLLPAPPTARPPRPAPLAAATDSHL